MRLKLRVFSLLALTTLAMPISLSAEIDFEWRISLNNHFHSDPYGYRHGLIDRFHLPESRIVVILDSVREPADAYMIFRLAELSGRPYDHVLNVYRQNRYASWLEIASLVGIVVSSHDFDTLRHRHDLRDDHRFDSRRYNRYEDKRVVIRREETYNPRIYQEQQRLHKEPERKYYERHDAQDERRNNDSRHDEKKHR